MDRYKDGEPGGGQDIPAGVWCRSPERGFPLGEQGHRPWLHMLTDSYAFLCPRVKDLTTCSRSSRTQPLCLRSITFRESRSSSYSMNRSQAFHCNCRFMVPKSAREPYSPPSRFGAPHVQIRNFSPSSICYTGAQALKSFSSYGIVGRRWQWYRPNFPPFHCIDSGNYSYTPSASRISNTSSTFLFEGQWGHNSLIPDT